MACPKCNSDRYGVCRCFRHDHSCFSCGYKWHVCKNGDIIEVLNHSEPLTCGCEGLFLVRVKQGESAQEIGKINMEKNKEKCVRKFKEALQYYAVGKGQKYCSYCADHCILKNAKKELATYEARGVDFDCGCGDCNP